MSKAKQNAALQKKTKELIAAYVAVYRDLDQDIGYTRKGERSKQKAQKMLLQRLYELENVWLDAADEGEMIAFKTAAG